MSSSSGHIREAHRIYQIALEYYRLYPDDESVEQEYEQARERFEKAWLEYKWEKS